ncbi:MAG TPA: DUF58 domain-containing protein [Conexibacter sp.]
MPRAAGIALLGLVLAVVAGVFDASPLYVPGVGFIVLGALTSGWVALSARGVSVTRTLEVRRVVEQEPLTVRIDVLAGKLPLPVATVEDPLLDAPLALPAGARSHQFTAVARFQRRGRRRVAPPALVLRDPLELARALVRGGGVEDLLVLPRTSPVAFGGGRGDDGRSNGGLGALLGAAPTEVDGVQPYREGTPASRIHWSALARGAGLMERRLRVESDARPLVVLDTRTDALDTGTSRHDLDMAVRAAASLTLTLARAGGCSLLLPGDRRPAPIEEDLNGWAAAHVRLALVDGGESVPAPSLASAGLRRGALLYVSARRVERIPATARAITRGEALLVVPGRVQGREAAFGVAGCSGYRMPASGRANGAAATGASIEGSRP